MVIARLMESHLIRSPRGTLAVLLATCLHCQGAVEVAGSLLVDLDAADFTPAAEKWPQHRTDTGIRGDFMAKGSPTRQKVAGAEAVVFDGDGDYFVGPFTTAALHAPGAKHSVEMWVYQGNIRDQESVVSWGKRWGRPDLSFAGFRYGSDPEFGAIARWGSSEVGFSVVPPPGQWHHIVCTYDGVRQVVYVDGEQDNTTPAGLLDAHDMLPIHLGAEICGDLKLEGQFTHYSGALARVRIHSGALDAAQVKRIHAAERADFPGLAAAPLLQAPVHRYSFNAPAGPAPDGTVIADAIGGLPAMIRGADAEFTGTSVHLPGGSSQQQAYLDFPNGLISAHENLGIEFWVTQTEARDWCRILSIGTNKSGEIPGPGGGFEGSETLTLFGNVGATRVNRFARSFGSLPNGGPDRNPADYPEAEYGVEFQQVITYSRELKEWHWYRNGLLMEVIPDQEGPTTIDDVNVWLGRSEFSADNNFRGRINEFRIYKHALSDGEIRGSFLAGPDKLNIAGNPVSSRWMPEQPGSHSFVNQGGSDHWNTGPGGPHPDGPGSTATFAGTSAGDQDISLSSPVTLGALNLGTSGTKGAYVLHGGASAMITMDSGNTTPASITQAPGCPSNHVRVPVFLKSDTEVTNQSHNPLVIDSAIRGSATIVKTGSGPVILTGDGGGFSGDVRIVAGSLFVRDQRMLAASRFMIQTNGQLVLNHEADVLLGGGFSGGGPVIHQGSGRITLPEHSSVTSGGSLLLEDGSGIFTSEGVIDGPMEIATDSSLVLQAKSRTNLKKWLSIGRKSGGILTLRDAAEVRIDGPGHLNIGDLGSGQSVLFMKGGTLSCRELFIGKNPGVSGILIQSGGDLRKSGSLDTRVGGGVPGSAESWGCWRMTGGTYQDGWNLQVGAHGIGVMEIDGGKVTVMGFLGIGRHEDAPNQPARGLLDVKSGSLTTSAPDHLLLVGEEGIGVLNIRNRGTVTCANRMIIGAGTIDKPGDGTVNLLEGGVLTSSGIGQFNQTGATGRLNFNGGTLKAGRAGETFLEGLDSAIVGKGGARIDSNGFDVTINQSLQEPEGNGVVSIPVVHGGTGYLGAPWIGITGGGGSGATAVANLENGSIKSITVTHPGNNYTSPPSISILGGGDGSGLMTGTPVLGRNTGGGLAKTGAGTLTLAGSNNHSGTTTVEKGGLRVEGHIAGSVEVAAKAFLSGNGSIGGSVKMAAGSTLSPESGTTLTINGDMDLRGELAIDPTGAEPGTIEVRGKLDLTGAELALKSSAIPPGGMPRLIASYGTLQGKFAGIESLPAGCAIDYHHNGLNRIALVSTAADGD